MCGRMTMRADPSDVARIFDAEVRDPAALLALGPRYNVAPTQPIEVVVQRDDGRFLRDQATAEWVLTAAVVTTRANGVVAQLHDRMPVILEPSDWTIWADPEIRDPGLLSDLLRPAADNLLTLTAVSPLVNNANNEGPELLLPPTARAGEEPLTLFG